MAKATVSNHYQSITDSILAALEHGVRPWARPWTTKAGAEILDAGLPFNASSGRKLPRAQRSHVVGSGRRTRLHAPRVGKL